jgi:hypothetical protein
MKNRAAGVAIVLTTLGVQAGCSTAASSDPVKHASASKTTAASGSPSAVPAPTAPASTPLGAGERAWAAFSHQGMSYSAWWAQLKPLLSEAAQAVYVYDDPRNIPDMRITDKIHVAVKAPAEPRFTAEVIVPTSKGAFRLDLERHTTKSPWLLYAIKFPPAVR